MSSRSRMGAGLSCSTIYVNVSLNNSGNKKQGIPSRMGRNNWANAVIQSQANGSIKGRTLIFCGNQLGGVGAGRSQFNVAGSFHRVRGFKCQKN